MGTLLRFPVNYRSVFDPEEALKSQGNSRLIYLKIVSYTQMALQIHTLDLFMVGFPVDADGKDSACNARDGHSVPGSARSPGGGQPTPVFLPGEPHGQGSLVGYSPCGHKELDTTE